MYIGVPTGFHCFQVVSVHCNNSHQNLCNKMSLKHYDPIFGKQNVPIGIWWILPLPNLTLNMVSQNQQNSTNHRLVGHRQT
jgi:hypothetical protein